MGLPNQKFIQHNRESLRKFVETHRKSLIEALAHDNWADLGFENNLFKLFVYVECGERVNIPNIAYFKGDIEKVRCYHCQKNNFSKSE